MFLIQKYTQYKAAQAEQQKRKVTEKELAQLNHKIDKLLTKLDEHEPEIAVNQDEECVVCVNAKATMQTYPCGHRVVCRKCFVKTIQMAVAQRLLPLRCVICRAKILRLKHSTGSVQPLPASASQYTIGHHWYNVPQSASLYSVTSNASAASGASSASSCSSTSSYKTCSSSFSSASFRKSHSGYSKLGYKPLRTTSSSPSRSPQPRSTLAMAMAKKDNRVAPAEATVPLKGKLSLIQEFRREFSHGKEKTLPTKSQMKESKLKLHGDGHCQTKEGCGSSNGNGGSSRVKGTSKQNSLDNQSFCGSSGSGSSSAGTLAGAGAAGGSSCGGGSTGSNGPVSSINGSSRGKGTSSSSSAGASRSNSSGSLTPLSPDGPSSRSASIGSTTQKRLSLESTPKMSAVASPGKVPSTSFLSGGTTSTSTSSTGNIAGTGTGPGLSSTSISSASSGCLNSNPTPNRKTTPNKPTTPTSNLNSKPITTNINSVKTMNQNINKITTSTPPPKLQPPPQQTITTTTTAAAAGSTGNFNSAIKSSSSVNPILSSRLSLTRSGNKEGNSNKSLPTTTKITTASSENASAPPSSSSSSSHLPSSGLAVNQ